MHKRHKVNGHVVHRLPKCPGLYYTVEPEHSCIAVYRLKYNEEYGELCYAEFEDVTICTKQLGRHGYLQEQIAWIAWKHNLNNTVFEEEKKMTEYYVIDVEMTYADCKTKDTECLQVRQTGNYFEIPFDGPDCSESEYRLLRLYERLLDYINETKVMFKIAFEKSDICSNSVLKITSPYVYISDRANREELCKMLTYVVEHGEYPYPVGNAGLSKVCFFLRECKNRKIYEKVYRTGFSGRIDIKGVISRPFYENVDYDPYLTDVMALYFRDGRLHGFEYADHVSRPANSIVIPRCLKVLLEHEEPFKREEDVCVILRQIHHNRQMWRNASYLNFSFDREKI